MGEIHFYGRVEVGGDFVLGNKYVIEGDAPKEHNESEEVLPERIYVKGEVIEDEPIEGAEAPLPWTKGAIEGPESEV